MKFPYTIFTILLVTPLTLSANDDTQVIDALSKDTSEITSSDLKMQSFESCQAFEDVMEAYIKDYWDTYYRGNKMWYSHDAVMMERSVSEEMALDTVSPVAEGLG